MVTPLISSAHNLRATLTRTINIVNGQVQIDNSPVVPPFYVEYTPSGGPRVSGFVRMRAAGVASPRQVPPAMLRTAYGLTGPSIGLGSGFRVLVLSSGILELEIIDNGTVINTGSRIVGVRYACQPLEFLYPLEGILSDMDGNPISNMQLAIWNSFESHDVEAGEFEDCDGEAPIEFSPSLMRNVDIMIGTTRYKILAAEDDLASMSVHLRLRKADEPLAP